MLAAAAVSSPPCLTTPGKPSQTVNHIHSLKICTTFQQIKQLHCRMTRTTPRTQSSASMSALIAAYARTSSTESLRYAETTLHLFLKQEADPDPDLFLFVFNSLLRAYSSLVSLSESMEVFFRILEKGLLPDRFSFPPLLSVCTKVAAFDEGIQLHGLLIKMGSVGGVGDDTFVFNSLIHFYSELGDLVCAQRLFDEMHDRNVVSWTILIHGYARGGEPRKAALLFLDMQREDKVKPNSVTVACVISACAKLQDLEMGKRIHDYIVDSGMELDIALANTLADMYMKCRAVETAERLFEGRVDRNIVMWNTMMSNYVRWGMAREALAVFNQMLLSGLRPDRVSVIAAMSAVAQLGQLMVGRRFHGYILRNGLDEGDAVNDSVIDMYMKCGETIAANRMFNTMQNRNVVSWNTLIGGCVRLGDLDTAWRLFDVMPERDLISWNTMINALAQDSQFDEVIAIFRELQKSGLKPERVTMVAIASACGYLGALDLAKWIYKFIEKNKIPCDLKLGTALVHMFAKCGDPKNALQIFDKMHVKDVSSWTAAIGALAVKGDGKRALELFEEMTRQGVKPDGMVFVEVLTACSHGGLVEEGQAFFESMSKQHGFMPQIFHYGCVVDMLGRAGLLKDAVAFIGSMPMEPNDVIWGALVSASCVHGNLEMAEYAAKQLIALAPERTRVHVLLSNAYASVGRWEDVARVRLSLKDKGFQKPPGSSLIEVSGAIHEFTSGFESHPQMAQIAEMLQEMDAKLAAAGHVPNLSNALFDVREEEKEHLLSRHSEKMAVAYGLISTSRGTPIRVYKNLRICLDCHSFMKLVSAIYDREIAIRDNNRFHFFKKGVCSCRDYW